MATRTRAVYPASADEAGLIVALLCLLLSMAPPLIVLVIPSTGLELSRIDGLHRITGVCSARFSFCVLMVGHGFNHRRSVIVCSIAGSVLLAVACICGTGCCSAFHAWIQGKVSASELPNGALFSSSLAPVGSVFLIIGHHLNLRWARQNTRKLRPRTQK